MRQNPWSMEGTGTYTTATANTFGTVMHYNAIAALFIAAYGTNPHTLRRSTMIAGHG